MPHDFMIKTNLEPIDENELEFEIKDKQVQEKVLETPFATVEQETAQEINAAEKDDSYGKILSKIQTQTDDAVLNQGEIVDDAKIGAQQIDAESQVKHLIDIAGQKGIMHAVKVARHMQDNYVLDTFHDRMLADELHDALVAKGMIEEI
ncbi:MAG: hypothetical protein ACD_9C00116G0002 [uncultured bacterium]|nr:MAG: hypothetical protein ACD_9C00116G0002 [uncultured bacterium]